LAYSKRRNHGSQEEAGAESRQRKEKEEGKGPESLTNV
jgi:hypothetical protein